MNAPAAAALAAPQLSLSLIGVPNCGKTALFNRLTGSRQKVANYPGVTVERKEGRFVGPRTGRIFRVVDLPGAYSLEPTTLDEAIARDVVLGRHASEPPPDLIVCVVDATNLRLNLRLVLELKRLGRPMIVALNMSDLAAQRGYQLDRAALERALGVPVIETVAVRSGGERGLLEAIDAYAFTDATRTQARTRLEPPALASAAEIEATQREVRRMLDAAGYRVPARVAALARLDQVVLHPVAGPLLLAVVLFLMFQAVFSWAQGAAGLDQCRRAGAERLARRACCPRARCADCCSTACIAGAGSVLVFLPQILILFAFILALEDSGYLPRAAFLLDRLMGKVGLSGRAFIPLLSSFACAIPGIMAARTIPSSARPARDHHDRPAHDLLGAAAGVRAADRRLHPAAQRRLPQPAGPGAVRAVPGRGRERARRGLRASSAPCVRGEYRAAAAGAARVPLAAPVAICCSGCGSARKIFLARVGTIILTLMVVLWFLASFPAPPAGRHRACDPVQHRRQARPRPRSTCSRRSVSTGRSRSRWCRDSRRARWR